MRPRNIVFFILLLVCSSGFHLWYFFNLPSLPGSDAYYYALQTQGLIEKGHLIIPDSSPVFTLIKSLNFLTNSSAQTVLVYFICSLCFLRLILSFLFPNRINLLLWIFASPSLFILHYEFPKQTLALAMISVGVLSLKLKRTWISNVFFYASMAISIYLHKSVLLGAMVLSALYSAQWIRWKTTRQIRILMVVSLLVFVGLAGIWMLGTRNDQRFSTVLSTPGVLTLWNRGGWGWMLVVELLTILILSRPLSGKVFMIGALATAPGFLPLFNEGSMSLGERVALMTPFFCLMALSLSERNVPKTSGNKATTLATLVLSFVSGIFVTAGILNVFNKELLLRYSEKNKEYEQIRYEIEQVQRPPLLISKIGLNYYLKYFLKIETFPYQPESHWDKKLIWRIVDGVEPSYFFNKLSPMCLEEKNFKPFTRLGSIYSLIREDCFDVFRQTFSQETDDIVFKTLHTHSRNPIDFRPSWLYTKYDPTGKGEENPRFPARPSPKK
jgi:hypothetical protein